MTCSVTAPIRSCAVITGASLVPVMVTSIVPGDQAAVRSSSVMVKLSTLVWPAARYSTAEVRHRVGPGQLAAGAGAGGVAVLDRRQRAEHAADRRRRWPMQCTSVRSTSVKVMVPLSVRLPAGGDLLGDRADQVRAR